LKQKLKTVKKARHQWFTPIILATQEYLSSKSAQANSSRDPISKKPFTKIGLVEWLKVKALSSSPNTTKKKKKEQSRK
jgi:hypothetical protein